MLMALSPEDREVLAYLISFSSNLPHNWSNGAPNTTTCGGDHLPSFSCSCFNCYLSYWVRWNSSPNSQLMQEFLEAAADGLAQSQNKKNKEERSRLNLGEKEFGYDLDKTFGGVGGGGGEDEEEELERELLWKRCCLSFFVYYFNKYKKRTT